MNDKRDSFFQNISTNFELIKINIEIIIVSLQRPLKKQT